MPRRTRSKRSKSSSAPHLNQMTNRPKKRKQWDEDAMQLALEAVNQGEGVNRTALLYGVPRTTLKDRISGRVIHGTKPGPLPYLRQDEERELSTFLTDTAALGYGKTRSQVKSMVESAVKEKGKLRSDKISDGWWRRFIERNPILTLRRGDATSNVRMNSVNDETVIQYFQLLKEVLVENDLMEKPAQLYNMDESGMPLDHCPPRVVARKGQKKVRCRTSGNKKQITVVGCVNAIGQAIPPMVIFDAKNLNQEWTKGEVPGTYYGLSEKGWIDRELFKGWLGGHFLRHAVTARPLLLLLDGHSSHYEPESVRYAKENGVIMLALPPHTTHDSQPLDVSVFGPLKTHWRDVCHRFMQENPGRLVTKYSFSKLFTEAWMKAVTPANAIAGFKKTGVYPFNPRALEVTTPTTDKSEDTPTTSSVSSPPQPAISLPNNSQPQSVNATTTSSFLQPACAPTTTSFLDPVNAVTTSSNTPTTSSSPQSQLPQPLHSSNLQKWSPEEIACFEQRYEEGYDLYDADYLSWLEFHHPDAMQFKSLTTSTSTSSLSKFLIQPNLPDQHLKQPRQNWGARVMTSAEHLAILEEKEQQKKQQIEEKESRKKQREEKRRHKEEELKKKAEERAKRNEERARKREEKARKAVRRKQPRKCTSPQSTGNKRPNTSTVMTAGALKRPRTDTDEIDPNCCPVCFVTYDEDVLAETGADWVNCRCGRWLHENCIEEVKIDSNGEERLCPQCLSVL